MTTVGPNPVSSLRRDMQSRKRRLWVALAVLLVIGAVLTAVLLRSHGAPDAVRLLPDGDAVFYVNLEPIRLLTGFGKKPAHTREAEYEEFVRQTGFEFERDLDRLAVAVHYGAPAKGATSETRYSEVFQGRFDHERVSQYLQKQSAGVDRYSNFDIYVIPLEGRTLRVVLLGVDTAAASNTDGPAAIHGIVDRYKQAALPFGGPALVRQDYHRVPLGSVLWLILRTPGSPSQSAGQQLLNPGSWSALLPRDSVIVLSARPLNEIHLRAQVITPSESEAANFTERAQAVMAIFQSMEITSDSGGPDPDVKAAFASVAIKQDKTDAVVTATLPFGFFKKLLSEPPIDFGGKAEAQPEQSPPAVPKSRKRK